MSPPERLDLRSPIPVTKEEHEHVARYAWASSIVAGDTLDIACGTGFGSSMLARHARVTGIDRAQEAIDAAGARAKGEFRVAEVPPIPCSDAAFDYVVCFETIEHIRDDHRFIREAGRVLRPGGELLISTPNKDVASVNGEIVNPWHVREYTLDSLVRLLTSGGLKVREIYVQSFAPRVSRGHRLAWALQAPAGIFPGSIRSALAPLLGDARVLPRSARPDAPGFWLARATPT